MNLPAKTLLTLALTGTLGLGAALLSSCFGGGGGDDALAGNSTVQGTVTGFTGTVALRGTGQSARAASGGFFVISGVQSGQQILDFTQSAGAGLAAGETASLALNVPDNSTVTLGRVTISGKSAKASGVKVSTNASSSSSSNANSTANTNASGNTSANGNDDGPDDNGDDSGDDKGGGKDDDSGNDNKK